MEPGNPISGESYKVRSGTVGALVAGYAFFDVVPIAVVVVGLTAWFERPLILFVITAIALIVINVACCRWLQSHESWISGNGERVEAKLDKMRKSRLMKHPVAWITRGSDWWFGLATAIVNPIIVVAGARMIGGDPISERRVMIAAVAYATIRG